MSRLNLNQWSSRWTTLLLLAIIVVVGTSAFRKGSLSNTLAGAIGSNESKTTPESLDPELAHLIDSVIDTSEYKAARWGVAVISLRDGRTVYSRDADKLFTPASNMKIYTTAVALDLLGPNYQWRTSVYAGSQPTTDGTIVGDLTLYGRGAPDLTSRAKKSEPASLTRLAEDLHQRGVRRIQGDVVADESYFHCEALGDGWQWNDIQWYFGAEPSALSIDGNEVDVEVKPPNDSSSSPTTRLSGAKDYVELTSNIETVQAGDQLTVGIHRGLSDNNVHVWGEFPLGSRGFGARLSIHEPTRLAGKLFLDALRAQGIIVNGAARARDFRVPRSERFEPSRAIELTYVTSKPLSEIVRATNKESINLNAELILRTLGKERGELAPNPDNHKTHERGDDEAGLAVIRQWLSHAGISADTLSLHDGSGLSRLDLVTPETSARLLQAVSKSTTASVFRESLPIAGMDGTLQGRLGNYKGLIAAKTGTLTYDNSLSGFLTTDDGQDFVFSIMCNDHTGKANSVRAIDEIVGILFTYLKKSRKP
jgi:serine-type D-Ala-D-Ala carboxypeptidase/endopeptidase (penicillin-binding protein 4)